jgi:hypothetical protein
VSAEMSRGRSSCCCQRLVWHAFKRMRLLRQRYAASWLAARRRLLASCNTLASQTSCRGILAVVMLYY